MSGQASIRRIGFQLLVGLSGVGVLAYLAASTSLRLQIGPLVLFAGLSLLITRSGFHATQLVTHCLVGMVDVAAILIFGPLGGAVVSGISGFTYHFLRSLRRRTWTWEGLAIYPLFDGGLKAWMALAAGAAYLRLRGEIPLTHLSWANALPLAALFCAWFALDQLGYGLFVALHGGKAALRAFLRTALPASLLIEFLPLPIAIPIAALYARGETALFALAVGGVLAASLTMQGLSDARQSLERRLRELTLLDKIGWDFARARLDVDELCELIYHYCSETVDTSTFMLGIVDSENQRVRYPLLVDVGERLAPSEMPFTAGIHWLQQNRRPLLIRDMERESLPFEPTVWGRLTRSVILLPLVAEQELIGMMSVQHEKPNVFDEDDLRILSALATQGALAIRKAQMYEAEQQRTRQLAAIARVTQQVGVLRELDTLFNLVVQVIRETFGYYYVSLFMLDPRTGALEFQAAASTTGQTCCFNVERGEGITGWVAESGEPLLANDVTKEPHYRPVDLLEGTKSELSVPLVAEGKILGVLDVQSDKLDSFTQTDLSTMQTVATQVAVAIHEARLYDRERKRGRQLAAVSEVGQKIVSILDLDEMLNQVVDLVSERFAYPHVHVFTIDQRRSEVVYRAGTRTADALGNDLRFALDGQGIVPWVARSGEPMIVNDVTKETLYRGEPSIGPIRSEMAIPLKFGKQILGIFDVQSEETDAFDKGDLSLFQALGDQIAVAVRNATLFASQQEEVWVSTVLLQVAEAAGQQTTLEDALGAIVRIVPLLVGVRRCTVFLLDKEAGEFYTEEAYSTTRDGAPGLKDLRLRPSDVPLLGKLQADRNPIIVPDEMLEEMLPSELVRTFQVRHLAIFPLLARGEVLGSMSVEFDDAVWPVSGKPLSIVTGIANQTATAIENAQLYDALQEEAYVSTALLQVAESINAAVDLDEALGAVVRITPILVGVDRCMIFLWDEGRRQFLPARQYGVDKQLEEDFGQLAFGEGGFPLLDELRTQKATITVADARESVLVPGSVAERFGIRSLLALPLHTKGEILGAMLVDFVGALHHFPENRLAILTGIAGQAAMAVENDRLLRERGERQRMEQELDLARSIQTSFLPRSCPMLPGWQVSALWRSARRVGGDFYDIILFGQDRVGFVIADVSDKGVPAALYMALSKTLIRAAVTETASPAAALLRANSLLVADSSSGMFVTVFYGVLDIRTGLFTYANAGHNRPILARAGGQVELLAAEGMVLGVLDDVKLEEKQVTIELGDAVLMYTDGLPDAINEHEEEFGMERLVGCVRQYSSGPAQDLIKQVDQEVAAHAGAQPQFDDYTLVALKRLREGDS